MSQALHLQPYDNNITLDEKFSKTYFRNVESFILLMNDGLLKPNKSVIKLAEEIDSTYSNVEYNRSLKTFSIISPIEQSAEKLIQLGQYWVVVSRIQQDILNNPDSYTNGLFIPLKAGKSRITHEILSIDEESGKVEINQTGLAPLADKSTIVNVLDQLVQDGLAQKNPAGYVITNTQRILDIDSTNIQEIAGLL